MENTFFFTIFLDEFYSLFILHRAKTVMCDMPLLLALLLLDRNAWEVMFLFLVIVWTLAIHNFNDLLHFQGIKTTFFDVTL